MKITNKMDGDVLVKNLAGQVNTTPEIRVVAQAVDLKDEANQAAQAYWMMGWTWDEIESVLEDSEYPTNVINYAIKQTKEYAKKVLNEGPFSVLKMGQKVKLINGSVGTLEEKYADSITINISDLGDIKVSADQLDLLATEKLREAYFLRGQAANMLYKLSTDQLEPISAENSIIDPTLASVDNALSTMASIKQNTDEVKREAAKLQSKWKADVGKWKPKSKEEQEFAQYMYAAITGESQIDDEINELFHNKLGSAIATLHDTLRQTAAIMDTCVSGSLDTVFPDIANKLEGHLYGITQRNARAREYVQEFEKFGKTATNWQADAIQWATASWEDTKEFIAEWENILAPKINNGIQLISNFLLNVENKQVATGIHQALKTV